MSDAERARLSDPAWKTWGPYVSERAWGTVREDYSEDGTAWDSFPHDHARSRTYRWNEDGLAGICDDQQTLCLAFAFWNGRDPILKERIFGLTGPQGNHGEDAKEYWFYEDSTPTHSWMRWRYFYPQTEFPYSRLVDENGRRGQHDPEFELLDTGVFDDDRYWDITIDYAKAGVDDIVARVRLRNAGPETAALHVLPTLWFRNTWSWGLDDRRPSIEANDGALVARHHKLGSMTLSGDGSARLLVLRQRIQCTPVVEHRRCVLPERRHQRPCGQRARHGQPRRPRYEGGPLVRGRSRGGWYYRADDSPSPKRRPGGCTGRFGP